MYCASDGDWFDPDGGAVYWGSDCSYYGWQAMVAGAANVGEYDDQAVAECCGDDDYEYVTSPCAGVTGQSQKCCRSAGMCIDSSGNCIFPLANGELCNVDGECASGLCHDMDKDYTASGQFVPDYRCASSEMQCVDELGVHNDGDVYSSNHLLCDAGTIYRCSQSLNDYCNTGATYPHDNTRNINGYKCYCSSSTNCAWQLTPPSESTASSNCADTVDNDCDGDIDGADSGCCNVNLCESTYDPGQCQACDVDYGGPDVCNWHVEHCCRKGYFWNEYANGGAGACAPITFCGWPMCWGDYCISGTEACCDAGGGYEYTAPVVIISP